MGATRVPLELGATLVPLELGATLVALELGATLVPLELGATLVPLKSGAILVPLESGATLVPLELGATLVPLELGATLVSIFPYVQMPDIHGRYIHISRNMTPIGPSTKQTDLFEYMSLSMYIYTCKHILNLSAGAPFCFYFWVDFCLQVPRLSEITRQLEKRATTHGTLTS